MQKKPMYKNHLPVVPRVHENLGHNNWKCGPLGLCLHLAKARQHLHMWANSGSWCCDALLNASLENNNEKLFSYSIQNIDNAALVPFLWRKNGLIRMQAASNSVLCILYTSARETPWISAALFPICTGNSKRRFSSWGWNLHARWHFYRHLQCYQSSE